MHYGIKKLATLAFAAGALAVAGCGSDDDSSSDGGGSGGGGGDAAAQEVELFKDMKPAPGSETVDTSEFKKDGDLVIGFSDIGQFNSWRVQARKQAELAAKDLGVELKVTDADGDATKQISDIEDLLAQNVDALVVTPTAPKPLAPAIERAADAGIPVIVWSTKADTDRYTAGVFNDEVFFGKAGAEKLVEDMGGKGKVIMLRGIAGISVDTDRYNGAMEAFKAAPGIEVIGEEYGDWAFEKGKAATENLLAAHPQIDGVWSSGAEMTRGAVEAFNEAGRELVPMSGEHNNGFLKIWQDEKLKSVAPITPTWMAPEAVKMAVAALRGQELSKDYLLTPEPITNDQVADWYVPEASADYWTEKYLTDAQITELFPK